MYSLVIFALFVFAVAGLTSILVDGEIFAPIRKLLQDILPPGVYKVFECYQCSGTWSGLICTWLLYGLNWRLMLIGAFAGSFIAVLSNLFLTFLEAKTIVDIGLTSNEENHGE